MPPQPPADPNRKLPPPTIGDLPTRLQADVIAEAGRLQPETIAPIADLDTPQQAAVLDSVVQAEQAQQLDPAAKIRQAAQAAAQRAQKRTAAGDPGRMGPILRQQQAQQAAAQQQQAQFAEQAAQEQPKVSEKPPTLDPVKQAQQSADQISREQPGPLAQETNSYERRQAQGAEDREASVRETQARRADEQPEQDITAIFEGQSPLDRMGELDAKAPTQTDAPLTRGIEQAEGRAAGREKAQREAMIGQAVGGILDDPAGALAQSRQRREGEQPMPAPQRDAGPRRLAPEQRQALYSDMREAAVGVVQEQARGLDEDTRQNMQPAMADLMLGQLREKDYPRYAAMMFDIQQRAADAYNRRVKEAAAAGKPIGARLTQVDMPNPLIEDMVLAQSAMAQGLEIGGKNPVQIRQMLDQADREKGRALKRGRMEADKAAFADLSASEKAAYYFGNVIVGYNNILENFAVGSVRAADYLTGQAGDAIFGTSYDRYRDAYKKTHGKEPSITADQWATIYRRYDPAQDAVGKALFGANRELAEELGNTPAARLSSDPSSGLAFYEKGTVLAQGIGSMLAFPPLMRAVRIGQAGKFTNFLAAASAGMPVSGEGFYRSAVEAGATQSQADRAMLMGMLVGTSEGIPIERMMGRAKVLNNLIDAASRNGKQKAVRVLTEAARDAATGAGEEALQEAFQTFGENFTAQMLYDHDRELFDGVLEAGLTGGLLGSVFSGMMSAGQLTMGQVQAYNAAETQEEKDRLAAEMLDLSFEPGGNQQPATQRRAQARQEAEAAERQRLDLEGGPDIDAQADEDLTGMDAAQTRGIEDAVARDANAPALESTDEPTTAAQRRGIEDARDTAVQSDLTPTERQDDGQPAAADDPGPDGQGELQGLPAAADAGADRAQPADEQDALFSGEGTADRGRADEPAPGDQPEPDAGSGEVAVEPDAPAAGDPDGGVGQQSGDAEPRPFDDTNGPEKLPRGTRVRVGSPDGRVVTVDRSNGYILSGVDESGANAAVDARDEEVFVEPDAPAAGDPDGGVGDQPYAATLEGLSDRDLKAEEKKVRDALTQWSNKGGTGYDELSARFAAVTSEQDAREGRGPLAPRMTQQQWFEKRFSKLGIPAKDRAAALRDQSLVADIREQTDASHRQMIERALADGKTVPDAVLADYPDLQETTDATDATQEQAPAAAGTDEPQDVAAVDRGDEGAATPAFDYASTQVNMPQPVADKLQGWAGAKIKAEDLAEDGFEGDPHLTIKYGLKTEDPAAVQAVADEFQPFTVRMGRTAVFPASESSGGADVLYVRADSQELRALNKAIGEAIESDDTFPTYTPHVTLAYLKPGRGQRYAKQGFAAGTEVRVDRFVVTDRNGEQTEIILGGTDGQTGTQPSTPQAPADPQGDAADQAPAPAGPAAEDQGPQDPDVPAVAQPSTSRQIVDTRLQGTSAADNPLGLIDLPRTLPAGDPLLQETLKKSQAIVTEESTIAKEGILAPGTYTRGELHRAMLDHFASQAIDEDVPRVIFTGGGSGAGMSTIVDMLKADGQLPEGLLELNADEFKALIPEFDAIAAAGDGRGAVTVHEESSMLAKKLLAQLLKQKKTFIFDATLANPQKSIRLMKDIKAQGYKVELAAVTVDPYEAAVRASTRAMKKNRYVPNDFLLRAHKGFHEGLQDYLDAADSAILIENTRPDAAVMLLTKDAENGVQVLNKPLLNAILKRKELAPNATTRQDLIRSYPVLQPSDQDVARHNEQQDARQAAQAPDEPAVDARVAEEVAGGDRGQGDEAAGDDAVPGRPDDGLNDQETDDADTTRSDDRGTGQPADAGGAGDPGAGRTDGAGQPDQADDRQRGPGPDAGPGLDGGPVPEAQSAGSQAGDPGGGPAGEGGGADADTGDPTADADRAEPPGYDPELVSRPDKNSPQRNHAIAPDEVVAPASNKARFKANMAALRLLADLRRGDGRLPTPDEKRVLAQYTGFGWANFEGKEGAPMLKELESILTKDEIKAVKASTLNAHYTRPDVIHAMWQMVERLGFKGGKVLEPAAGVGHFIGVMPEHLADRSRVDMIELDIISGQITRMLYPEANVEIDGFQHTPIDNATVDLAISNVPFGSFKASGAKDYPNHLIHDYFFARALDKVKPGGLVAFITSNGTMDKANKAARKEIAGRADLVASVRLPAQTFGRNAGTDVTTDIIILRKHGTKPWKGAKAVPDWMNVTQVGEENGKAIRVNHYYAERPEHALGTHRMVGSRYAADSYTMLAGKEGRMSEVEGELAKLPKVVKSLPKDIMAPETPTVGAETGLEAPKGSVDLSHVQKDGDWYQVINGKLQPAPWLTQKNFGNGWEKAIDAKELASRKKLAPMFFALADARDAVIKAELAGAGKKELDALRKTLNRVYDNIVKRTKTSTYTGLNRPVGYGHLAPFTFLLEDPAYYRVLAMEREVEYTDKKQNKTRYRYEKQAIFSQPTVARVERPTTAASAEQAIGVSLNFDGRLELDTVADLLGVSRAQAAERMRESGQAFLDPQSGEWMPRAMYLSGPVLKRLKAAQSAVDDGHPEFKPNVEALKAVQPKRIAMGTVSVRMSSRWIPDELLSAWATSRMGDNITVRYVQEANEYIVDGKSSSAADLTYGTPRVKASKLLLKSLSGQAHQVYDKVGDSRVLNRPATEAAARAQRAIERDFEQWIKTSDDTVAIDGQRKSVVLHAEDVYNDVNNGMAKAEYTGEHMTFPGLSKDVWLKPYRTRAVSRIIQDGGAVLAHGVGSGKAQPLDSKLLTPSGWTTMGEIRVGDEVIAGDGSVTRVIGVYPQGVRDVYEVKMSDGASTRTCDEHLWLTHTDYERSKAGEARRLGKDWACARPKVRQLSEIRETLVGRNGAKNHAIPVVGAVHMDPRPVPLDAYLLGVLLGDGCLKFRSCSLSNPEPEIIEAVAQACPEGVTVKPKAGDNCDHYLVMDNPGGRRPHPIMKHVRAMGLNVGSHEKFVPEAYKFNSIDVRLATLQGLMDTDGYVESGGYATKFCTSSEQLADDVTFLVRSLGGVVTTSMKYPKGYRPAHVLNIVMPASINPFRLARKRDAVVPKSKYPPRRFIVGVEKVSREPVQCIAVEHPEHLYVTDDLIVTHNTLTMIMAAYELKRTGLRNKPLIVVKKPTITDFASAAQMAYPTANVLVSSDKSFSKGHRERFMNQIAVGDWDMVIITQEQFTKLSMGEGGIKAYFDQQLEELETARRASNDKATTKQLEKSKNALEGRLQGMLDKLKENQDRSLTWEEMGIDQVFIDEVHDFKKIPIVTKMRNIKGVPNDVSQRAMHLDMVAQYTQARGGGIVGATGTPITNTVAEAYVMLKLARPDVLDEYRIYNFDDFAHTFGEAVEAMEFTYAMKFRFVTRFNRLTNIPELTQMIRQGFDVAIGNAKLGLDVPRIKGGAPQIVEVEATPAVEAANQRVLEAVEQFEQMSGEERRENSWVPIVAMGYGTAAALDPRLVDPEAKDEPGSKVNTAIKEVLRVHKKFSRVKGTQLIFADRFRTMNTAKLDDFMAGKALSADDLADAEIDDVSDDSKREAVDDEAAQEKYAVGDFNLYEDIRNKLVKAGVPREQIAVIGEAGTDNQRQKLFADVNAGKVRILLGSTEKMGVGVNVQKKLVAVHELDPPRDMTPAKAEQRRGRGERQGHDPDHPGAKEIEHLRYGVPRSMDGGVWQKIEQKARFIDAMLSGEVGSRTMEDLSSEATAGFSELSAIMSGDPRALRIQELQHRYKALREDKAGYDADVSTSRVRQQEQKQLREAVKDQKKKIAAAKPDVVERFSPLHNYRAAMAEQIAGIATEESKARSGMHEKLRETLEAYGLRGTVAKEAVTTKGPDGKPKEVQAYIWRREGAQPKALGTSIPNATAELQQHAAENPLPRPEKAPPFEMVIAGKTFTDFDKAAAMVWERVEKVHAQAFEGESDWRLTLDVGAGYKMNVSVEGMSMERVRATGTLVNPEGLIVGGISSPVASGQDLLAGVVLDAPFKVQNILDAKDRALDEIAVTLRGLDERLTRAWDGQAEYDKVIKELDQLRMEMAGIEDKPEGLELFLKLIDSMDDPAMTAEREGLVPPLRFARGTPSEGEPVAESVFDATPPATQAEQAPAIEEADSPGTDLPGADNPDIRFGAGTPTMPGVRTVSGQPLPGVDPDRPAKTKAGQKLVNLIRGDEKGEKYGMRSINKFLTDAFKVEMREGLAQVTARNPAYYMEGDYHIIRTKTGASHLVFHESGHALSALLRDEHPGFAGDLAGPMVELTKAPGSFASEHSVEEGFAEYIRRYVNDPVSIPVVLRKRLSAFLKENYPEALDALNDARLAMEAYMARSSNANFRSDKRDRPRLDWTTAAQRAEMKWHHFLYTLSAGSVLDTRVHKRMFKALKAYNSKITQKKLDEMLHGTDANFQTMYAMTLHAPGEARRAIEGSRDGRGLRVYQIGDQNPLLEALKVEPEEVRRRFADLFEFSHEPGGVGHGHYMYLTDYAVQDIIDAVGEKNWDDFEDYGHRRAALNRYEAKGHEYPSLHHSQPPHVMRQEIEKYEADHPEWPAQFARVEKYMNQLLLLPVLTGQISAAQAVAVASAYENEYWPLSRSISGKYQPPKMDPAAPEAVIERAYGSSIPFAELLDVMTGRVTNAMEAYYQNAMGWAMFKATKKVTSDPKMPLPIRAEIRRIMVPLRLDHKKMATMSAEERQQTIADYLNQQAAKEMNLTVDQMPKEAKLKPADVEITGPGMDIVRAVPPTGVKVLALTAPGGEKAYFEIGDPLLYEFYARTREGSKSIIKLANVAAQPISTWKRGHTQTVAFTLGNAGSRDPATNFFILPSYIPFKYTYLGAKNRLQLALGIGGEPLSVSQTEMLSRQLDATSSAAHKNAIERFKALIAEDMTIEGWKAMNGIERSIELFKNSPRLIYAGLNKPRDIVNYVTFQRFIAQFTEGLAREGAYIEELGRSGVPMEAQVLYDAGSGRFIERPGGPTLQAVFRALGFVNPGVQMLYQTYRKMTTRPGESAIKLGVLLPMIGALTAVVSALFWDEEDRRQLRERSDGDRLRYMNIKGPIHGIRLRMPFDYGPTGAMMALGYNMVEGHLLDEHIDWSSKTVVWQMYDRITSLPGATDFFGPFIEGMLELKTNHSFFFEEPIVPNWLTMQWPNTPELQAYDDMPNMYTWMGKKLGVSPIKIQYAMRQFYTSSGMELIEAVQAAYGLAKGDIPQNATLDPSNLPNLPWVGRLFARTSEGWRAKSMDEIATLDEAYRAAKDTRQSILENIDRDAAESLKKTETSIRGRERTIRTRESELAQMQAQIEAKAEGYRPLIREAKAIERRLEGMREGLAEKEAERMDLKQRLQQGDPEAYREANAMHVRMTDLEGMHDAMGRLTKMWDAVKDARREVDRARRSGDEQAVKEARALRDQLERDMTDAAREAHKSWQANRVETD